MSREIPGNQNMSGKDVLVALAPLLWLIGSALVYREYSRIIGAVMLVPWISLMLMIWLKLPWVKMSEANERFEMTGFARVLALLSLTAGLVVASLLIKKYMGG